MKPSQVIRPSFLYYQELPSFTPRYSKKTSVLKWVKVNYRKEFIFVFFLLLGLFPQHKFKAQAQFIKEIPVQPVTIPAIVGAVELPQTALNELAVQVPPPAPTPAPAAAVSSGCGDNFYANYIYMHESGCRTNAINPIGACGIGQALPCSKMGCSLSDYTCQNDWFTNYAMQRYGSWEAAYNYWLANHNW